MYLPKRDFNEGGSGLGEPRKPKPEILAFSLSIQPFPLTPVNIGYSAICYRIRSP